MSENGSSHRETLGLPWLMLCLSLAIHVADEIHCGLLSAYALAVEAARDLLPFLPVPHLSLTMWLFATVGVVALLAALTPLAYRGVRGMRTLMLWFIGLAIANFVGHLGASLLVRKPMPGVYSAVLLLAAAVYAIRADRRRVVPGKRPAATK